MKRTVGISGLLLVLAMVGAAPSGAVTAAGRISAHLTSTTFTVAQADQVKVIYTFSSRSGRFGYVLARRSDGTWVKLRSVDQRGSFTGTHRKTVAQLFGTKPVRTGHYRVRLFTPANSVTLRFAITKAAGRPSAGSWVATDLTGPVTGSGGGGSVTATNLSFVVPSDRASVGGFGFGYEYSGTPKPGQSCSGAGFSGITQKTSPIENGTFTTPNPTGPWSGPGSGTFQGTFDSATTAHGTAQLQLYIGDYGCFTTGNAQTGTFSWTATWRHS